jgi:RimJ/RimL family protein N-acetyltransferase
MSFASPITLTGRFASLTPLSAADAPGLCEAARDGELWKLWYTAVPDPSQMSAEIARRLSLQVQGSMLPFSVRNASGQIVGMTTYMNIVSANRRVEIGSTWTARSAQRTALNTECKFLLLQHAFDTLNCIAVEFRTHRLNQQSRRAIERLGAQLDGVLRQHMVLPDGSVRDTAVYSITRAEWPVVSTHLQFQLNKSR